MEAIGLEVALRWLISSAAKSNPSDFKKLENSSVEVKAWATSRSGSRKGLIVDSPLSFASFWPLRRPRKNQQKV